MLISCHSHSKKLLIETELLKGKVEQDALTGAGSRTFGTTLLLHYSVKSLLMSLFCVNLNQFKIQR